MYMCFFFFNDPATTEIYTLSLHDALPILALARAGRARAGRACGAPARRCAGARDRKSTRLNSSHTVISYAVFCLKKKIRLWLQTLEPRPHSALPTNDSDQQLLSIPGQLLD